MENRKLTPLQIESFTETLRMEERAPGTIEKYHRDVAAFARWLEDRVVTKEAVAGWKDSLLSDALAPVTVNSKLSAVNCFLRFAGWEDCQVKLLRIQQRLFREQSRELTRQEYERLLETARALGQERLALLLETICSTGIRVSEVQYITVESVQKGQADISLKGKIRTILLPRKLCRKLLKYARKQKNASGEIFLTRSGTRLSRRQIWREMKNLCEHAGVLPSKVFPHNLRHLFAETFYHIEKDIVKLAGVLGHSSIETTRIYLLTTGAEHRRILECLKLVQ